MRDFSIIWYEIQNILRKKMMRNEPIVTLCKNVRNIILEVGDDYVVLLSEGSRRRAPRKIVKDDLELVYRKILEKGSIHTLNDINEIRGKRAITCAIIALHKSISGACQNGKVLLRLM
ncbi:hypothetical protein DRO64_06450 [Candidatus Bathyarchaeota archaeon]|nr:MAG: hypothetical protein DRO64_06450 [Candidatus Bathyarchaeota archaeon]